MKSLHSFPQHHWTVGQVLAPVEALLDRLAYHGRGARMPQHNDPQILTLPWYSMLSLRRWTWFVVRKSVTVLLPTKPKVVTLIVLCFLHSLTQRAPVRKRSAKEMQGSKHTIFENFHEISDEFQYTSKRIHPSWCITINWADIDLRRGNIIQDTHHRIVGSASGWKYAQSIPWNGWRWLNLQLSETGAMRSLCLFDLFPNPLGTACVLPNVGIKYVEYE